VNERIRELEDQAWEQVTRTNGLVRTDDFNQKFAQLIVAECMTTILKESKWYWDKDEFESANAVQNAARRVKEHFGVDYNPVEE
jgi:hypothetical protein